MARGRRRSAATCGLVTDDVARATIPFGRVSITAPAPRRLVRPRHRWLRTAAPIPPIRRRLPGARLAAVDQRFAPRFLPWSSTDLPGAVTWVGRTPPEVGPHAARPEGSVASTK